MDIAGQYSPVAVRIGAARPRPGENVLPSHVAVCPSPDAVAAVEDAWWADLRRAHREEPDPSHDGRLQSRRDIGD